MLESTKAAIIGISLILMSNIFYLLIDHDFLNNLTSEPMIVYKTMNVISIIGYILILSFFVKLYQKQVAKKQEDEQGN